MSKAPASAAATGLPTARPSGHSEIDQMAKLIEVWSSLDDDQRAVYLELLRALAAMPEGENSDHLFARADQQIQIARAMAYLDRCGATFREHPGFPGWYEARWTDPAAPDGPCRWCCKDDPSDREQAYAQAFRARVESHGERS